MLKNKAQEENGAANPTSSSSSSFNPTSTAPSQPPYQFTQQLQQPPYSLPGALPFPFQTFDPTNPNSAALVQQMQAYMMQYQLQMMQMATMAASNSAGAIARNVTQDEEEEEEEEAVEEEMELGSGSVNAGQQQVYGYGYGRNLQGSSGPVRTQPRTIPSLSQARAAANAFVAYPIPSLPMQPPYQPPYQLPTQPQPTQRQQRVHQHPGVPITNARKNSVKANCPRPEESDCVALDTYGEWEGSNGRFKLPIRRVFVDHASRTMHTQGSELKHLGGCSQIERLFPEPGNLTCTACNTTFSTAFNAASHGICKNAHFRCPPCGREVTTLAAMQKHVKTPKHRACMEGWIVDGIKKTQAGLERQNDGVFNGSGEAKRAEWKADCFLAPLISDSCGREPVEKGQTRSAT